MTPQETEGGRVRPPSPQAARRRNGDAAADGGVAAKAAKPRARRRSEAPGSWQKVVQRETNAAFSTLKRNALIDLVASTLLFVVGLGALIVAVTYTIIRGDDMVGVLLGDESVGLNEERVIALTLPVLLLLLLAALALAFSWALQSRGGRDFARNMEAVSRLRREAEGGVSRTRTSTHALEEHYSNARRAFRLQLWLSRTLFLVCLVLFTVAVVDAILRHVDLATVALGAGSILSLIIATLTGAGTRVGTHFADTTQIQLVVGGATRQVNILEDHLYEVLERSEDPKAVAEVVHAGADRIAAVVGTSLELIQRYAEPPGDSRAQDED